MYAISRKQGAAPLTTSIIAYIKYLPGNQFLFNYKSFKRGIKCHFVLFLSDSIAKVNTVQVIS